MFQNLRGKLQRRVESKWALVTLAAVAFVESSFFPIPPDAMLIPMALLKKEKWVKYSLVATAASVIGGLLGYLIGFQFYDHIAVKLIDFYHMHDQFKLVEHFYRQYGFFAVFAAGLTPIPYKVFTIAAGLFKMNIISFTMASIVGRGARFVLEGFLVFKFGEAAVEFINRHFALATTAIVVLTVLAFILWRIWQ